MTSKFGFNRRHKLFGHLFCGRYKSLIVDGSGRGYLMSVCDATNEKLQIKNGRGACAFFLHFEFLILNLPDLGEETFRQELLAQMSGRMGAEHYGEEPAEKAEAMAEQIIAEELKRRRWKEVKLLVTRGS